MALSADRRNLALVEVSRSQREPRPKTESERQVAVEAALLEHARSAVNRRVRCRLLVVVGRCWLVVDKSRAGEYKALACCRKIVTVCSVKYELQSRQLDDSVKSNGQGL